MCLVYSFGFPTWAFDKLQTCFRDGKNIVDFTYVDNVVEGHILAEKHLSAQGKANGQVIHHLWWFPQFVS